MTPSPAVWLQTRVAQLLGLTAADLEPMVRAWRLDDVAMDVLDDAQSHVVTELCGLLGEDETRRVLGEYRRRCDVHATASTAARAPVGASTTVRETASAAVRAPADAAVRAPVSTGTTRPPLKQKQAPTSTIKFQRPTAPTSTAASSSSSTTTPPVNLAEPLTANPHITNAQCDCLATVHALVRNCLACGKIICTAEGDGPCRFCGSVDGDLRRVHRQQGQVGRRKVKATTERVTFRTKVGGYGSVLSDSLDSVEDDKRSGNVVTDRQRQQQRELRALEKERNATELAEAFPKLRVDDMRQNDGSSGVATAGDGRPSGLDKAEALKKRLLAFDRGDASRNAVHDASEDFHAAATDAWLTPEERALAVRQHQEYERRVAEEQRRVRVAIDLESRRVVSEAREVVERPTLDGVRAEVARAREVREADSATMIATTTTEMQLHAPHVDYRPVYVGTITEKTTIMANKGKPRAGATSAAVTSTKTSRLCPVDDDGNRYFNDDDNDAVGVYGGWDRDGGIESQD